MPHEIRKTEGEQATPSFGRSKYHFRVMLCGSFIIGSKNVAVNVVVLTWYAVDRYTFTTPVNRYITNYFYFIPDNRPCFF